MKDDLRTLVHGALNEGQRLGFDSAISICKRMAVEMKGDFAVGASVCAELIEKMRDAVASPSDIEQPK
jgi:hypothetical protein